ncbi:uncharacterized protein BP01DRAFT_64667 [Aspergillus saccharolyticus JOP 1030-1]|uniref:Uncharacterized protein n=1 Tax=Aspergillus saccharolyticus JOP 1030-1 TaxID=1450539 RepID=A0A318ZX50_9EURO|nr:hypothetical protein BP01DRAFT_64667 [Aspergillus saccharolyticus JOP 1030-1]PYH44708.1 hypothetical protein BP01DRAFT_64667 [Aspergillus saccharolyticus JOP 1030-1]
MVRPSAAKRASTVRAKQQALAEMKENISKEVIQECVAGHDAQLEGSNPKSEHIDTNQPRAAEKASCEEGSIVTGKIGDVALEENKKQIQEMVDQQLLGEMKMHLSQIKEEGVAETDVNEPYTTNQMQSTHDDDVVCLTVRSSLAKKRGKYGVKPKGQKQAQQSKAVKTPEIKTEEQPLPTEEKHAKEQTKALKPRKRRRESEVSNLTSVKRPRRSVDCTHPNEQEKHTPEDKPTPKNRRKHKLEEPIESTMNTLSKRARPSMNLTPISQEQQSVEPDLTPPPRQPVNRTKASRKELLARLDSLLPQKDATQSVQQETPFPSQRVLHDRSLAPSPVPTQSKQNPGQRPANEQQKVRSPAQLQIPQATASSTHSSIQDELLQQTAAVTSATYNVIERQLETTESRRALATDEAIDELTTDTRDVVGNLPLNRVLSVAKYLDREVVGRVARVCKTVYDRLKIQYEMRQDPGTIPEPAWRSEVRVGLMDEEGRRTVEWIPGWGWHPGPMALAIQLGRLEDVRAYLAMGADRNCLIAHGVRPLRWAVATGQLKIVQLLLEDEADPNLLDADGSGGALAGPFMAPGTEIEVFVEVLLDAGAKVCNMDAFENLCRCRKSVQYVRHAIANKSELAELRGPHGETVLHCAADYGLKAVVRVLIGAGIPVDEQDAHGQTAVQLALRNGNEETALALMDVGCALHLLDNWNRDALTYAIEKGYLEVVRLMLEPDSEIDFNATRRYGASPSVERTHLEAAMHYCRLDIMKEMLLRRKMRQDVTLQRQCRDMARMETPNKKLYEEIGLLIASSRLGFDSIGEETERSSV